MNNEVLKEEKVIVSDYHNRRIGDFLKEQDLTEERTTIYRNIKNLVASNLLKRIGSDKTGYWEIL
jgi:predicted HTH transcriptional regulator